jgi:hypothetical protein
MTEILLKVALNTINPSPLTLKNDQLSIFYNIIFSAYVGCFFDKDDRMLPAQFLNSNQMTVEMCIQHCRGRGFAYSGVQV